MSNCIIINGKSYADEYCNQLKEAVKELEQNHHTIPGLAVVLLGEDPASLAYVGHKTRKARDVGINVFEYLMPANTPQKTLIAKIENLNNNSRIHGILVQLPLPKHIDADAVVDVIDVQKDVDGFNVVNVGKLHLWRECFAPCTPIGVLMMLKRVLRYNLAGKKAVIIGRSRIVGRPLAAMLMRENCSVTVLHSKSQNIVEESRTADILISATGNPGMVKKEWVKPGACVVDVGIVRIGDKLYGDVDFDNVKNIAGFLTPVPGGVGPMTVACVLSNTIKAVCLQKRIEIKTDLELQINNPVDEEI